MTEEWLHEETLQFLEGLREPSEEQDFLVALFETYRAQGEAMTALLRATLAAHDRAGLGFAAHSFKGSSFNIGAHKLASLLGCLEAESANSPFDSMQFRITAVEAGYAATCQSLALRLGMEDASLQGAVRKAS